MPTKKLLENTPDPRFLYRLKFTYYLVFKKRVELVEQVIVEEEVKGLSTS